METSATVTTKGQITIPKAVRDALGLGVGDSVLFRVDGERAMIARTPNLLELAGSIDVPVEVQGLSWAEIEEQTHQSIADDFEP